MWRVKVCGLTRAEDAIFAAQQGAEALGFVLEPKSPRFLQDDQLPALVRASNVSIPLIGVFANYDSEYFAPGFDAYQGEGTAPLEIRSWIPVFRPKPQDSIQDWIIATEGWSVALLDPFHEFLGGGTGQQLDLGKSAEFVKEFSGKVILAGGINAGNVANFIKTVKPWGVDASSGLETSPGVKSTALVERYIDEALSAFG